MWGTAAAAASLFTVTRTSSLPAWCNARTCAAVASTSAVSVLVIDWTTIGWAPPTFTPPTSATTVLRRGCMNSNIETWRDYMSPLPATGPSEDRERGRSRHATRRRGDGRDADRERRRKPVLINGPDERR